MPFKIAVIGCGWISSACHAPAYVEYARSHPQVRLAACCDTDVTRAEKLAGTFGFETVYTDYRAMLQTEKPDVVCLNVNEKYICEIGCQVLQASYPLLTEKPPGLNLEEIDRLIEAARSSGAPHQVAFNRRFTPLIKELKHSLENLHMQYIQVDFARVKRSNEDFSTTAIHAIDLARFLTGRDYEFIRFSYQAMPELGPNTANFRLVGELAGGLPAVLNFFPVSGEALECYTVFALDNLLCASIAMGPAGPGHFHHAQAGCSPRDVSGVDLSQRQESYFLGGFYDEDAAFFDAVQSGGQSSPTLAECRQSIEIMQCLRQRVAEFRREEI
jgi:myo-inositol 2-dehydrogenase / D-chiro-inositol 1-dehydrogenase